VTVHDDPRGLNNSVAGRRSQAPAAPGQRDVPIEASRRRGRADRSGQAVERTGHLPQAFDGPDEQSWAKKAGAGAALRQGRLAGVSGGTSHCG
jgi:hypothetical protein